MRLAIVLLSTAIVQAAPIGVALAQSSHQELKGFWNNGDARNWDRPVAPNSSQGVSYRNYPLVVDQVKAEEEAARVAPSVPQPNVPPNIRAIQGLPVNPQNLQNAQQIGPNPELAAAAPAVSTPLSREQIMAKFGAPDQPQPIRAQKDSPPAMQGLFEALNSNDKELAWQYAVALAKRQREMQQVVSKASDYQMLAMEALGLRPAAASGPDGEAVDAVRNEVQDLMAQTRQAEFARQMPIPADLGQEAALADGQADVQPGAPQMAARAIVRPPHIPVDPEGKVKLLIFLDEKLPESKQLAEKIAPLREKFKADPNLSVLGLTRRTYNVAGLKMRGAELSFPFPLLSGEALALDLRIQSYPTFVFVAATTRQTYRIEGVPALEEIEKTVKAMRGVK